MSDAVVPEFGHDIALGSLRAGFGNDVNHAAAAGRAVEHGAATTADFDMVDIGDIDGGGVKLTVIGGIDRNPVQQKQYLSCTQAPDVDTGSAIATGAYVQAWQQLDGFIQIARARLPDVLGGHCVHGTDGFRDARFLR